MEHDNLEAIVSMAAETSVSNIIDSNTVIDHYTVYYIIHCTVIDHLSRKNKRLHTFTNV